MRNFLLSNIETVKINGKNNLNLHKLIIYAHRKNGHESYPEFYETNKDSIVKNKFVLFVVDGWIRENI